MKLLILIWEVLRLNKKHVFILMLLIVAMGSISVVSAENSNMTDAMAVDDEDNIISAGDENNEIITEEFGPILADVDKAASEINFSEGNISFKYGESGSTEFTVDGGSVGMVNVSVLNCSNAIITIVDNKITVSGLPAGNYQLFVGITPDENHTAVVKTLDVNVGKANAIIKASKLTVVYKTATEWSINLVDSKGKAIANTWLTLKVYTGNKYKTVSKRTNSKGVVTYKTSGLSVGTHKIIVSLSNSNYSAKSLSSSVKVIKQTALKFKPVKRASTKSGAILSYLVINKKTGKGINGVKLKVLVYTGKKYTSFTLKTKKFKTNHVYNGAMGFATNKFSVGMHTVKIMPVSLKYKGSATSSIVIKKSATRYSKYLRIL